MVLRVTDFSKGKELVISSGGHHRRNQNPFPSRFRCKGTDKKTLKNPYIGAI